MPTDDYLSLFFYFDKSEIVKHGMESGYKNRYNVYKDRVKKNHLNRGQEND